MEKQSIIKHWQIWRHKPPACFIGVDKWKYTIEERRKENGKKKKKSKKKFLLF